MRDSQAETACVVTFCSSDEFVSLLSVIARCRHRVIDQDLRRNRNVSRPHPSQCRVQPLPWNFDRQDAWRKHASGHIVDRYDRRNPDRLVPSNMVAMPHVTIESMPLQQSDIYRRARGNGRVAVRFRGGGAKRLYPRTGRRSPCIGPVSRSHQPQTSKYACLNKSHSPHFFSLVHHAPASHRHEVSP